MAPWQNRGDNGGGASVSVALARYLGLGEEGDEIEVDRSLLPRRLTTVALPPHPSTRVLAPPPQGCSSFRRTEFFSGVGSVLPRDGSGAGVAVTPWLSGFCGLEREKVLDFFFLLFAPQLFRFRDWSKT